MNYLRVLTVISALFILNLKGNVLISKLFRSNLK
jgi:hypothetical protein